MCIIQGGIKNVNGTNIFVAPTEKHRQLTVYSNKIEQNASSLKASSTPTPTPAMILPVVSKSKGEDIELLDLSNYKDIFKDLEKAFMPLTNSRAAAPAWGELKVLRVGSYDISIVPTREDFDRLQQGVFSLDPNIGKLFADKYSDIFSFVVCKLVELADYHPIAYVSPRLEDGSLFVPTYHYHGKPNEKADWDHAIYVAYTKSVPQDHDSKKGLTGGSTTYVDSCKAIATLHQRFDNGLKVACDWKSIQKLSKTTIGKDYKKNHDIVIAA